MADSSMDPDAALMVAFQRGDHTAFEQILDKYHARIVNFIYKIVNDRSEAEELAQDVFLKVFRAGATYEPRARFAAWIYRIATNSGLKALQNKRRWRLFSQRDHNSRGIRPDAEEFLADPGPSAEARLVKQELGRIVRQAIGSLPGKERVAIVLYRYEGLSYKEIAEAMNCTEAAVKTHIHRGKLKLRDLILPYLER
jgi:RNA polymerase sigma-70 factor, ECF subfamily